MASLFKKERSRIGIINLSRHVTDDGKWERGGICEAKLHYAEASNVYMEHFDESKESSYLQYYDANSLYA